jgi:hypothetical protein
MDNGLIVPYPLVCANAESSDTNVTILVVGFSESVAGGLAGLMG